ncbi:alpha/beta fold hydrolase [Streptomyces swartbergensis]|uniref:Alpha/beta hydrolase n=1 Tax=Streptomyces swartbergensis TaxID=487165 RepID=A0A2C9ZNM4_9ACTN|nr:alpha/beta hydrolase [Streptomyces swartbergensis]OUD04946.1 alpha/beta hydrolase [Streptomyces swartbergensis]
MTERIALSSDVQLWSEEIGAPARPPVLLIAGGNQSSRAWPREFVDQLTSRGLRVVRYDHRDTGRSTARDFDAHPYTYTDMARDAIAVLDAHDIAAAHVVAMSMGTIMAQLLALDHPERLLSLTLMLGGGLDVDFDGNIERLFKGEASIDGLPLPKPDLLDALALMSEPVDGPAAEIDRRVERSRIFSGDQIPFDSDEFRRWEQEAADHAGTTTEPVAHHMLPSHPRERAAELARVRVPTQVIQALNDPIAPPPHGRHLAEQIPGARLVEIPGMGHALPGAVHTPLAEAIAGHALTIRSRGGH